MEYIKKNNYIHTYSKQKLGLCSSVNKAAKLSSNNYILYAHDDMYFLPKWDFILKAELDKLNDNLFYLSGTMIDPLSGHIKYNCGNDYQNFDEEKLLNNYKRYNFYDHQGSHLAPHLIHKTLWEKIGGFSEEFDPGIGSDPDLNMKLWKAGVRLFKGINDFKVYHFGSISTRKKNNLILNRGGKTFLKKWGITVGFFKKHYLKSGQRFHSVLKEPNKNLAYYCDLFLCKLKVFALYFQNTK